MEEKAGQVDMALWVEMEENVAMGNFIITMLLKNTYMT